MDLSVYKLIHLIGLIMMFTSLGGLMLHAVNGGGREDNKGRKIAGMTHGLGLFLLLLGGFGMLAKLGIKWPWPGWIITKMILWLVLGGIVSVIYRKPELGKSLWFIVMLLGFGAAYLALMKPF